MRSVGPSSGTVAGTVTKGSIMRQNNGLTIYADPNNTKIVL
jgi:hypothetical protein